MNLEQINNTRRLALNSFYFFALGVLGLDYIEKEVHYPVCNFLSNEKRQEKLLLLPRGFLKSSLTSIALPMWLAFRNPNIRNLIVCNIITNSMKHLAKIKDYLERNDFLRALFPDIIPNPRKTRWKDDSIVLTRDAIGLGEGTIDVAGIGTNLPSRHYDRIFEDDIVTATHDDVTDRELAPSQMEIDKAIGWHRMIASLFDTPENGYLYHVATRWCQHDPVQFILDNEPYFDTYIQNVYKKVNGKMVEDGEPIYPRRFGPKSISKLRHRQGPYIFSTQYLLKPIPSELMVFKEEWIKYYEYIPKGEGWYFAYIDPASSSSKNACNTAILVGFFHANHKVYLVEEIRKQGMGINEAVKHLFRIAKEYKTKKIGIETVGFQEQLYRMVKDKMLEDDMFFTVESDRPRKGEAKGLRIENLQPRVANGQILIKKEHLGLKGEMLEYQGIEKSKFVDTLDCLAGLMKIGRFPSGRPVEEKPINTGRTLDDILEELKAKFHEKEQVA